MDKVQIIDYTDNGKCTNCGSCCPDILSIDEFDFVRIKNYVKEHDIKESHHPLWKEGDVDLTCPFRDHENKICKIYEVRPKVCRGFIRSRNQSDAQKFRDSIIEDSNNICRSFRIMIYNHGADNDFSKFIETKLFRMELS